MSKPKREARPALMREMIARCADYLPRLTPTQVEQLPRRDRHTWLDLTATSVIAKDAQTLLLDVELARELIPAMQRLEGEYTWRLPWSSMIVQFSQPISETDLLAPERNDYMDITGADTDPILAVVLDQRESEIHAGTIVNNAIVWFQSTAVNRVAWQNAGGSAYLLADPDGLLSDAQQQNKENIRLFTTALATFLAAENVTLVRRDADPDLAHLNAKRQRQGQRPIPNEPYHVVEIHKTAYEGGGGSGAGAKHSYMYPVRAHLRRLHNGSVVWVRAHYRGVAHGAPPAEVVYRARKSG